MSLIEQQFSALHPQDEWLDELVVIPARYKSSRLPGKPLVEIAGKPMIVRTAERCLEVKSRDRVVVATDDERIAQVCFDYGIHFELTGGHPTGGDRIGELAKRVPAKVYINVQGDEPVFNPEDLELISVAAQNEPEKSFIGYCKMPEWQWRDSKYTRLIFGLNGQLIYIGRAQVPGNHTGAYTMAYRQVCLYSYSRETLLRFAAYGGRAPLETIEDHETMRFLELGLPVHVLEMSDYSMPVDRPEDIPLVEARVAELGL